MKMNKAHNQKKRKQISLNKKISHLHIVRILNCSIFLLFKILMKVCNLKNLMKIIMLILLSINIKDKS